MTTTTVRRLSGPEVLRPKQVRDLLAVPDRRTRTGRRDAALLAVMVLGGLRVAEACRLTRDNLEMDGSRLRLVFRGKGSKLRTVTLPAQAARLFTAWLASQDHPLWCFPGRRNEHLSVRQAQDIVTAVGRAIGAPWLHAHSLRHTFASLVMQRTGNLFLAQNVLGHASPTTTSRYYLAFSSRDADDAAEAVQIAIGKPSAIPLANPSRPPVASLERPAGQPAPPPGRRTGAGSAAA